MIVVEGRRKDGWVKIKEKERPKERGWEGKEGKEKTNIQSSEEEEWRIGYWKEREGESQERTY